VAAHKLVEALKRHRGFFMNKIGADIDGQKLDRFVTRAKTTTSVERKI
jgi:hypothetical protein